jgi:hypothetical protein
LNHIQKGVKEGNSPAGENFFNDLQADACIAGIPFDETKMKSILKEANETGVKSILGRMREAVDREDFSEMFKQLEYVKDFEKQAGIFSTTSQALMDGILNDAKESLLQKAQDLVKVKYDLRALDYLDWAKRCADEIGSFVDPESAANIIIPLFLHDILDFAKLGDVRSTEEAIKLLDQQATIYGFDPLTYEYRVQPALKLAYRNGSENAFRKAEAELAAPYPIFSVIQDALRDAEEYALKGGIKFNEERAEKIMGCEWIVLSTYSSENALAAMGDMGFAISKGDLSGAMRLAGNATWMLLESNVLATKGLLTFIGL